MNIVYSVEQVNATTSCLFPKLTYFYNCYITEKHGGIIVRILGGKLEKNVCNSLLVEAYGFLKKHC